MKRQDEGISKEYDFFYDDDNDDDKNFPDDISIKQESDSPNDVLIKQESDNEIDDRETIPYTSPKRENVNEIDEKIYKEPKLETAVETGKQAITDEEKFIKTELDANKVDLETSEEAEIKKIEDVFDVVKKEETLKYIENFFIDDNGFLIVMKFLKAISNLLWTLLIELTLLLIQKSLLKIPRWQKWKLLIRPLNKKLIKKNKSLLTIYQISIKIRWDTRIV